MVKALPSTARGVYSILDLGARIPHAWWPGNQNRSNVVTDSIKTLKHRPQQNKQINLKKKKKNWSIMRSCSEVHSSHPSPYLSHPLPQPMPSLPITILNSTSEALVLILFSSPMCIRCPHKLCGPLFQPADPPLLFIFSLQGAQTDNFANSFHA